MWSWHISNIKDKLAQDHIPYHVLVVQDALPHAVLIIPLIATTLNQAICVLDTRNLVKLMLSDGKISWVFVESSCTEEGSWAPWSPWGYCSTNTRCGGVYGSRTRARTYTGTHQPCSESSSETAQCRGDMIMWMLIMWYYYNMAPKDHVLFSSFVS